MKRYKHRLTFTYHGKRYVVYANTLEELYAKKAEKKKQLEDRIIIYDDKTTVDAWAEEVFNIYKIGTSGLADTKNRYYKYVSPHIGFKPLANVRAVECQNILNNCAGMSFSHLTKLKQEMAFIFRKADSNQLIQYNPATDMKLPVYIKGTRRSITEKERRHLYLCYEKDPAYLLFIIILECGCRPDEAVNLIGRDIDHKEQLLHIRGTKTKNSDRYVPIPDALYATIQATKPFDPICTNRDGRKHTNSSYIRLSEHLKRDMNISMGCKLHRNALVPPYPLADDFVPYCLRHTYCTDLCKAGIDVRTAQRLMGHANISVTADIYTHVDMDDIKQAAKLIEAYAAGKGKTLPRVTHG